MHEHGMAEELAAAVKRAISGHGDNRVVRIVVEAGAGSLERESLDLAFAHASEGTNFANAELVIQKAERMYHCLSCGIDFNNADSPNGICPSCTSSETISAPSHDITLKSVEIED
ncbi:MAG: hydrogenase maturation nickel metallochaperone HypA [Acidimicrobiaceae bacterium]|nr:hydrogenase maturation nickel metallochaperone HypA [Acidimicrobiaceae bacterium]